MIEHKIKMPVEALLFFFGLANAGVVFSAISEPTWLVLFGLLIGKPVGIFLFGMFAIKVMHLSLPDGMRPSDLIVLGCVAGIGLRWRCLSRLWLFRRAIFRTQQKWVHCYRSRAPSPLSLPATVWRQAGLIGGCLTGKTVSAMS